MKFIAIKNHKISFSQTHNLEVPGSSPGWSTLKTKQLSQKLNCFFFYWCPLSDLFEAKLISCDLLKFHEMISN